MIQTPVLLPEQNWTRSSETTTPSSAPWTKTQTNVRYEWIKTTEEEVEDLRYTCASCSVTVGDTNRGVSPGSVGMKNGAAANAAGGAVGLFLLCRE